MIDWSGREVRLQLSESGRAELAAIFGDKDPEVLVRWADELGLWIVLEMPEKATETGALVRWNHFETAIMDVVVEPAPKPNPMGFGMHIVSK